MLKIALLATGAAIIDVFASTPDPNTVTLDLVGRKDVGGCAGQGGKNLRFSTSTADTIDSPKHCWEVCAAKSKASFGPDLPIGYEKNWLLDSIEFIARDGGPDSDYWERNDCYCHSKCTCMVKYAGGDCDRPSPDGDPARHPSAPRRAHVWSAA